MLGILLALSASHLINDTLQALLPAIYPMLKVSFSLTFTQIGLITLSYQLTASLLQPFVGSYTDRRPKPYSLAAGMALTLAGLACLSLARSYGIILLSSVLVGMGSSIFHPEASRVAHMAAGERHGFAQSLLPGGGQPRDLVRPAPRRAHHRAQRAVVHPVVHAPGARRDHPAYQGRPLVRPQRRPLPQARGRAPAPGPAAPKVVLSLSVLIALVFSKYFYLVSLTNYYTFYLIQRFDLSIQGAQLLLFVFLVSVAAGTILGGPLGDRFGRKYVIWVSILGVAPFSLALPHVGLTATVILTVFIGRHPGLRVLGDPGLRPGADSRAGSA